ncbi:MAG TPA: hypothetical protein VFQ68_28460, partial [Streptosporangiaceae bacterium]|nr:hypothetical protein [Streptosporangiaceae bacterium]
MIRGWLTVRVTGLVAGIALVAGALTAAPVASAASVSSGPTGVGARSAAVQDVVTGKLLWSRALNTERPMASITKVMTAYLVLKAGNLNREITVPAAVTGY